MQLRPFEDRDTDAVIALWQSAGLTRPWNDPALDIRRKSQVQPELFVVAELDGAPVGTVMAGYDGHRGWINYLATSPALRGRGIGAALLAHVEARLVELGCPKVQLQIRPENDIVVGFYEQFGFERFDTIDMGKRLIQD